MNSHSTIKKKGYDEADYVNSRVRTTKQEIEQLKNELEKLIQLGTKPSHLPADGQEKPAEMAKIPNGKHVEIRSLERPVKIPVPGAPVKIVPTKTSSSKKNKSYNIDAAREYIKKQREKRAEQLKAQIHVTDNKLDLKKQKLRELHQKTIELVNKNVQLKRERSNSRDKEPPVRLDKSNPKKNPESAVKTNSRLNIPSKSQERKPPIPKNITKARSHDRLQVAQNVKTQEKIASQNSPKIQITERVSRSRVRDKPTSSSAPSIRPQKLDTNLLCAPNKLRSKTMDQIDSDKTFLPDPQSLEELRRVDLNEAILNDSVDDIPVAEKKHRSRKHKEHPIKTHVCVKDNKETQTSRQNDFGEIVWMQPPQSLPYPYNFINTVKRKLQCAINSPSCVDVGVQKSDNSKQTPQLQKVSSIQEIKEMMIRSAKKELRSFASHNRQNLDLKVVENLELIPNNNNNNKSNQSQMSKNLFTNYDSESDTSKNIPDISSESLGSVHSKPQLSLDKLKNLKLQKLTKSQSDSNVKTDTNGYPEKEHNTYSSDFQKETISTKSNGKSDSNTIRTIVSEKKVPNLIIPSDTSLVDDSSTFTNYTASGINQHTKKSNISEHSELTHFTKFINTQLRGDNSRRAFKSLFTESKIPKSPILSTDIFSINESLALKQPSASLSVGQRKNSDVSKIQVNTITIRSPIENRTIETQDECDETFKSLLTIEESGSESISENLDRNFVSNNASGGKVTSLSLKQPSLSLVVGKEHKQEDTVKSQMKNITVRRAASPNNNANEIHLKFEAEVRLLNDFNESFKQFIATEKAFENLKSRNENLAMTKMLQNVDTQTSFVTKTSTNVSTEKSIKDSRPSNSLINYSRGSDFIEELDDSVVNNNISNTLKSLQNTTFSTDWNVSNLNDSSRTSLSSEDERSRFSISGVENYNLKNCASNYFLSLNLFDQLIKDEDVRIQQLKAIIKIRVHALLDRTKSELLWLEIQKKQLLETGKIEEASLLKKKQRGIILKRDQERNEIKKLKQMQKEVSEHRKNTLKQQRNLIKNQLSTDNMLSKISVKKRKERRSVGPLRVVQSRSESIHSETSISLKSSGIEDILNIASKSIRVSGEAEVGFSRRLKDEDVPISNATRTLLMREAALQKRRKAAEELLQWHRKLLEDERKINELEATAISVVKQPPPEGRRDTCKYNGKQLNQLWKSMTGCDDKKFAEDKRYVMSQISLERLCKSARQYSNKNKKTPTENSEAEQSARKSSDDVNYSSVFENESVHSIINSQEEKTKISSISELIDNFSRIEDEISTLSKKTSQEDKSSQSKAHTMTPNHVDEVPTVETNESEKTVPEDSDISSVKETIEEEPQAIQDISTPHEDIEEVTSLDDNKKTVEDELSTTVTSTTNGDLQRPKSAQDFSEIPTETQEDDSEQINSITEVSPLPESHKDHFDSPKTDSEKEKPVSDSYEVSKSVSEVLEDGKIPNDEEPKSVVASIVTEVPESPTERGSTKEENSKSVSEDEKIPTAEELKSGVASIVIEAPESPTECGSTKEQDSKFISEDEKIPTDEELKSLVASIVTEVSASPKGRGSAKEEASKSVSEDERTPTDEELTSLVASIVTEVSPKEHGSAKEEKLEESSVKSLAESTSSSEDQEELFIPAVKDLEEVNEEISSNDDVLKKSSIVEDQDESSTGDQLVLTDSKQDPIVESPSRDIDVGKELLALDEALESASKIEESLSKLNEKLVSEKKDEISEDISSTKDVTSITEETPSVKSTSKSSSSGHTETGEKIAQKKSTNQIDVKKRVSEILADVSPSRGDKGLRLQDLYVTAYDVGGTNATDLNESSCEDGRQLPADMSGIAEELLRKQLAIEQEIKQIELQQKEQIPFVFLREIPNKPPPPYTPPSSISSLPQSVLATDVKELSELASYSSKVLYKAYQNSNLDKVKFSEQGFKLFSKVEVSKICAEYVFNICRDVAKEHYKQFEIVEEPSWLTLPKKPQLTRTKPSDAVGLEKILTLKLKELFGFKKVEVAESAIIKWGRKKRDHVDEVLVVESQEEEYQWINFEKDELIVKSQLTDDIMKMLLEETAIVFAKALSKKNRWQIDV